MNAEKLRAVLDAHELWLRNNGGQRANLSGADLRIADLSDANLRYADLCGADLRYANLCGADLRYANLSGADLRYANLCGADLRYANLSGADLRIADLSDANLSDANLRYADLSDANLRYADLSGADLRIADLRYANLSGTTGLLSPAEWMAQFERDSEGWIVYKRVGNTDYAAPARWAIAPGAILTEVVNPDRGTWCGCGVNFGTRAWCDAHYHDSALWRCRIRYEDGPAIVVPYNTDGKARCARLELLEEVSE